MFTFSFLNQQPTIAETKDDEIHIVVSETKTYKDTEITLQHAIITQDKTTLQIQLHGEQVKDLIVDKKGEIYVHKTPRVMVSDDQGKPLKSGAKKEDKPDKGKVIEGRMHNISADTIEMTNYYETGKELPEFLILKVMEFSKNSHTPAAEFKVDL